MKEKGKKVNSKSNMYVGSIAGIRNETDAISIQEMSSAVTGEETSKKKKKII